MHRVEISRRALRQIKKLSPAGRHRVAECFDALALAPRPSESKELLPDSGIWRLRRGRYRVLYLLDSDRLLILGVVAASRQRVTRLLEELSAEQQG